ncbi:MAG: hypothetical protein EPO55_08620 [Reyranella sp.]|uniref:hypothetical protein n=1 Tax=Reyranella sp. TaxID=1929291 RepID=UPI00120A2377|nr:hypothetical protein [Reyranella sp.]TAJ40499.1 MAG: hypothetical protein EPO55_08620 [Reyranella sp.]
MNPVRPADDGKRVAFLYELLLGANASLAAAQAGLNRGTAYRWKLEDPEFAALWAEIVASRPRRRDFRRRLLECVPGRMRRRETSQLASHGTMPGTSPKAAWDKDLGLAFEVR